MYFKEGFQKISQFSSYTRRGDSLSRDLSYSTSFFSHPGTLHYQAELNRPMNVPVLEVRSMIGWPAGAGL